MKPSIGRIVLFHPRPGVTQAAIVAYVHSDTMVNLAVFGSNGETEGRTSVQLVAPGQPQPEFGFYCEWMPYPTGGTVVPATAEACMTIPVSKATADAMERIIQKIDEKILAED